MGRLKYTELTEGTQKNVFERVRNIIIKKIKAQNFLKGDEKTELLSLIKKVVLKESSSVSKSIGEMWVEDLVLTLTQRGMRLKDEPMMDIIAHEFMHLLANTYFKKDVGHSWQFKRFCKVFGYGHISMRNVYIDANDYRNDRLPIWLEDHLKKKEEQKKKALSIGGGNLNQYRYAIKCTICGMTFYKKRKTVVMNNLSNYRCGCGGILEVEEL